MLTTTRFLLAIILLLLSTAGAAHAANAVIITDANLRANPDDSARIITILHKDRQVLTKERDRQWVKVEVPSLAKTGWVHHTLIKEDSDFQVMLAKKKKILAPKPQKINKTDMTDVVEEKRPAQPMLLIGVIDIQQVINQSQRGRQARKRFDGMRLTGSADMVAQIEQKMISQVITEIQTIVENYAGEKGFTHILNKNSGSVFYNEASFDITGDIIREYDRQVSLQQPAQ